MIEPKIVYVIFDTEQNEMVGEQCYATRGDARTEAAVSDFPPPVYRIRRAKLTIFEK